MLRLIWPALDGTFDKHAIGGNIAHDAPGLRDDHGPLRALDAAVHVTMDERPSAESKMPNDLIAWLKDEANLVVLQRDRQLLFLWIAHGLSRSQDVCDGRACRQRHEPRDGHGDAHLVVLPRDRAIQAGLIRVGGDRGNPRLGPVAVLKVFGCEPRQDDSIPAIDA